MSLTQSTVLPVAHLQKRDYAPARRNVGRGGEVRIRHAQRDDRRLLRELISEMGQHQGMPVVISEDRLAADGFGPTPRFQALIAEVDAEVAGYALLFDYYSSFRGPGLFLEDLYVREPCRSHKVGQALFSRIAALADERECFGIVFNVLIWNTAARRFFEKSGATVLTDCQTLCLSGAALRQTATRWVEESTN